MLSNNDQKVLSLIENLINLCLRKLNDSYFVQSTFADLKRLYENLDDKDLKFNIKIKSEEILTERNQGKIKKYLEELLFIISKTMYINKTYLDVPLDDEHVGRSNDYKNDCRRYIAFEKNINEMENRILTSSVYQKKLHEFLKEGNWKNYYHARLTDNLRIIFRWDKENKKVKFEAIVTHDEIY